MSETEFITLVARMREQQKLYFKTRSQAALVQSRQLEKEVDEEIKRIMAFTNPPAYQPSLFDKPNDKGGTEQI